jgi:hypothetical protein
LPVVSRRVDRRTALKALGSLSLLALPHPAVPLQQGETWTPRFLTDAELDTATELAELIIPQTDSPGAKVANVHQYIDFVLSEATEKQQGSFRSGLAWLDDRSGSRFVSLDERAQIELLEALSADGSSEDERGVAFFEQIKQLTVQGYYRSRAGMIEELDYDGNSFLGEFEGCAHPEHHDWSPEDN